jgi:hypothetical protein
VLLTFKIIGIAVASVYLLFGLYLLVMPLKRNQQAGNLTIEEKVLGYPWVVVMLVVDFAFNVVFGTLIFLELPKQLLLTTRLDEMLSRTGWRKDVAHYICTRYLDRFDPDGKHCEVKNG